MATSKTHGGRQQLTREGAQRAASEEARREAVRQERARVEADGAKKRGIGQIDIPLLTITLILLMFGLVMLFSASYPNGLLRRGDSFDFIRSQMTYAVIGLVAMVFASFVDYRYLRRFAKPLMIFAFMLLVIVLFMPAKNDAHRWIWLNAGQTQGFQPSEIAKFALILMFARMIAAKQDTIKTFRHGILPFVGILGAMSVLLLMEPHISCTIQVLGIGIVMMFAGGAAVWWFIGGGVAAAGGIYALVTGFHTFHDTLEKILPTYAMNRITVWLDLENAPTALAHQTYQSLIAVGSGGATGQGIGQSVQKYLYLPEVYNDYIFAVVCEELGLIGALAVILLFMALLIRGIMLAMRARDKFGSMLIIGIISQVTIQALLHVAVNINAIPSTGISLPFFSSGGTSLTMLLGEMGVALSVSRKCRSSAARKRGQAQTESQPEPVPEPAPSAAITA